MKFLQNSTKLQEGDTFICLPEAERYLEEVIKKNAGKIVLVDPEELGDYLRRVFDNVSQRCRCIGITGTNGKTTVAYLVNQALNKLGKKSRYLGTLNSSLTTPDAATIHATIAEAVEDNCQYFVLEASSHGIAQNRLAGLDFQITALTNITHDHLDYHHTFEAYKQVKLSFLQTGATRIGPERYKQTQIPDHHNFWGEFNDENLQLVKTILLECQFTVNEIDSVLMNLSAPPGRLEHISEIEGPFVFVDFAHTPDSLDRVLKTAKKWALKNQSELIVLFGCGGDRDSAKRPLMGAAASRWANKIIITSDNPRSEPAKKINNDIYSGICQEKKSDTIAIEDRNAALRHAFSIAKKNDIVILAGKGHEEFQVIGDTHIEHNDKRAIINIYEAYKQ